MIRRRSRSVAPPHTPAFSRELRACSRHAARTPHPAQTVFRGQGIVVVIRVEDAGVQPTASPQLAPFDVTQRHVGIPHPTRLVSRTIEPVPEPRQRQSRALCVTVHGAGALLHSTAVPDEPQRAAPFRTGRDARPAGRRAVRRARRRRRDHRRRRGRSTPPRRGLRTALVERDDFASGTSSKSSKLVHGGLRYLQQGDVRLVYEALHERQRLRRNAPHLVKLLPFMIPILTRDGADPAAGRPGARLGDVDVRPHRRLPHRQAPQAARRPTPPSPTCRRCPASGSPAATSTTTPPTDDARLVPDGRPHRRRPRRRRRQPLPRRRAHEGPPTARSTAPIVDAGGRRDRRRAPGSSSTPPACGPTTSGRSRTASTPTRSARPRACTSRCRGSKVRNDIAVVIPVPQGQAQPVRRAVGRQAPTARSSTPTSARPTPTTTGPLDDPPCTADDIAYVLGALNDAITTDVTADDVTGVWAGLRPLVKSATSGRTADLSRRHRVTVGPGRRRSRSPAAS